MQLKAQQANNNNAVAAALPKGIFVYLGNVIPKQGYYQVEKRIAGENRYAVSGKVTAPQNEQELQTRQTQFLPLIENIDPLTNEAIHRIWNYIGRNAATDTLYSGNLPMMHLLAGTGYIDDKTEKGKSYQYRVSLYDAAGSLFKTTETNTVQWPLATTSLEKPKLKEKSVTGSKVYLEWFVGHQGKLSHFNVYRSVYGKDDFKKITPEKGFNTGNDSIFLVAVDSIGEQASYMNIMQCLPISMGMPVRLPMPYLPALLSCNYVPPVLVVESTVS